MVWNSSNQGNDMVMWKLKRIRLRNSGMTHIFNEMKNTHEEWKYKYATVCEWEWETVDVSLCCLYMPTEIRPAHFFCSPFSGCICVFVQYFIYRMNVNISLAVNRDSCNMRYVFAHIFLMLLHHSKPFVCRSF